MMPARLHPPLSRFVVETEVISEYLFLDSIANHSNATVAENEFRRRWPQQLKQGPRRGREAFIWVEYLAFCQRRSWVQGKHRAELTRLGYSQLESLREEARELGVALPD